MPENRPTAAYTLTVVGVALQALAGILLILSFVAGFSLMTFHVGPMMMGPWFEVVPIFWIIIWLAVFAVVLGLGVYGAALMNSGDIYKVRNGSTIVLVSSIIAFPTLWGFMIGSLLMFIGSLLGLTWRPPTETQPKA